VVEDEGYWTPPSFLNLSVDEVSSEASYTTAQSELRDDNSVDNTDRGYNGGSELYLPLFSPRAQALSSPEPELVSLWFRLYSERYSAAVKGGGDAGSRPSMPSLSTYLRARLAFAKLARLSQLLCSLPGHTPCGNCCSGSHAGSPSAEFSAHQLASDTRGLNSELLLRPTSTSEAVPNPPNSPVSPSTSLLALEGVSDEELLFEPPALVLDALNGCWVPAPIASPTPSSTSLKLSEHGFGQGEEGGHYEDLDAYLSDHSFTEA